MPAKKYSIILINAIVILWLLKVIYFDESSDVIGIFTIGTIIFLIIYNLYAWLILYLSNKIKMNKYLNYVAFYTLLIIPFLILYYMTS